MRFSMLACLGLASVLPASAEVTIEDTVACNADVPPIDFLVLERDANSEAIEDGVRQDQLQIPPQERIQPGAIEGNLWPFL